MSEPTNPASEKEDLFWNLESSLMDHPAVTKATMMGFACLRFEERFFASIDRRTAAMIVKLPANRVTHLIGEGSAEPFMPNGRVFKQWAAIPNPDQQLWSSLLDEALEFAQNA